MYLLFVVFAIAVIASPIEMQPSEEIEKELTFLKMKIKDMERSETLLTEKIENMEKKFETKIASLEKKLEATMENFHNAESRDQENTFEKSAEEVDAALIHKSGNNTEERISYLEELSKLQSRRSCQELSQYGVNINNFYYVDPDGSLIGDAPIRVWCEFSQDGLAITEVLHNSEEKIDVDHCHDPGCYVRPVLYSAPDFQIQSLIQLSDHCEQSIEYNCLLAPLEDEGVNFGFWLDKNGEEQVYWDGANSGQHVCGCFFEEGGCLEQETKNSKCNCDAGVPEMKSDMGTIKNMSALPISQLQFGGLSYEIQQASHRLGRLRCWGKADFDAGTSCTAIKKAGEFRSGFYNVKKSEETNSQLVFCKSSPGYEENGNNEVFVESSEDHFLDVEANVAEMETDITKIKADVTEMETEITDVGDQVSILQQRSDYCAYTNGPWTTSNSVITYDKLIVSNNHNLPGATLDINTGEFKAGTDGIYQVDLSMNILYEEGNGNIAYLRLNGVNIPESEMYSYGGSGTTRDIGGRSMKLHLNSGDKVSVYAKGIYSFYYITYCVNLVK